MNLYTPKAPGRCRLVDFADKMKAAYEGKVNVTTHPGALGVYSFTFNISNYVNT